MRAIYCLSCGTVLPTPPDDAARGLFERRTHGKVRYNMNCDMCNACLRKGDPAIAITIPQNRMPDWEQSYLE